MGPEEMFGCGMIFGFLVGAGICLWVILSAKCGHKDEVRYLIDVIQQFNGGKPVPDKDGFGVYTYGSKREPRM